MTEFHELFDVLDLERDGWLTRQELYLAARKLGWQQPQAPLYALLDYLTIRSPLERETFAACMDEASRDPLGFYGTVLRHGPLCAGQPTRRNEPASASDALMAEQAVTDRVLWDGGAYEEIGDLLREVAGKQRAGEFGEALERSAVPRCEVRSREAALLIIDPQQSFTGGDWMWRLGPLADMEIMPIQMAFGNCARLLRTVYRRVETMFSRCPFAPESYGWDEQIKEIVDEDQLYFIKPSNNLFMPAGNGYAEWVRSLVSQGIRTLVLGGCTLNSCLRVSAVATRDRFPEEELHLVVDLSLCGARASNYLNTPQFGGISAVEAAMREMSERRVTVAERVVWVW